MMCLGLEAVAAGWKAQTNPLSYGGTPKFFNGATLSHLPPHSRALPLSLCLFRSLCHIYIVSFSISSCLIIFMLSLLFGVSKQHPKRY